MWASKVDNCHVFSLINSQVDGVPSTTFSNPPVNIEINLYSITGDGVIKILPSDHLTKVE